MRSTVQEDNITEVLVSGDEDPLLVTRQIKHHRVFHVVLDLTHGHHISTDLT